MRFKNFNITFLGTSAASVSPQAFTSAYLVEINRSHVLIDAGIGVLRQLRKTKLSPSDIDIILVTHWHLDHYAGLPAVLRAKRKSTPRPIFGPPIPLSARLFLALALYPWDKTFEAIREDFSCSYADFRIEAIPNSHFLDSYGWVIAEKPEAGLAARRMVISGDTRPAENVLKAARGADLLVHEATYLEKDAKTALLHQHSTAAEAADLAAKAGVGALALTHIPNRYTRQEVQEEAQTIFGRVFVPSSLDKFHLEPQPDEEAKKNSGWAKIMIERE